MRGWERGNEVAHARRSAGTAPAPRSVASVLGNRRMRSVLDEFRRATSGPARELPFRRELEAAFGRSFAHVRAFTGAGAALANLGARAAAADDAMAFAAPRPTREQVAHELVHVVQGARAADRTTAPSEAAEREATRLAPRAARGEPVHVRETAAPAIHLDRDGAPPKRPRHPQVHDGTRATHDSIGTSEPTGELAEKVVKLTQLAGNLSDAANTIRHGKGDRTTLDAAGDLAGAADALGNAAQVYAELSGKLEHLPTEEIAKVADKLSDVTGWLDFAISVGDSSKLDAFLADPDSPVAALAWADDVATDFAKLAKPLPDEIPFVSTMIKGYLGAPAVYLKAFTTILDQRERKLASLDADASNDAKALYGGKVEFRGALARAYFGAPRELQDFMYAHKKTGGVDLEKVGKAIGIPHLLQLIHAEHVDPAQEGAWVSYLGSYL